jgi:hypothetical protein
LKTILKRLFLMALLLPFRALAADPPTGGPTAGSGYKSPTSEITDWILFAGIVLATVLVFYAVTRLIRGRGMRG